VVPATFEYHRPDSIDAAVSLLGRLGDEARLLAGGHSLIPAMKFRLAQPKALVDLSAVRELRGIQDLGDRVTIGAMTTHAEILDSALLATRAPIFRAAARQIGDVQVRNLGTIGGSLAHADPAADWPAVVLALEADMEIASAGGRRTVAASDFFVGMMQTSLEAGDVLCSISVRGTSANAAYVKTEQKASGFALCGVAAIVDQSGQRVRIGVTGIAPVPYRAHAVEAALEGRQVDESTIAETATLAADGVDPLGDIHASPDYRRQLAQVNVARALRAAIAR
jgi:aerobic carbon-monoxide dehydrogenase medium subunit